MRAAQHPERVTVAGRLATRSAVAYAVAVAVAGVLAASLFGAMSCSSFSVRNQPSRYGHRPGPELGGPPTTSVPTALVSTPAVADHVSR